jgi:hypothetical protein
MKVRWWKTRKNPKGVKKREKKSRDKIIEIITVENNISKMMSDKHILSKIKSNLGVSSDAKVDIVILDILSQIPLGISNDVY